MNPTIALWYTRKQQSRVKGRPPNLEVHINLWRHHPGKKDFNLLDIGIRVLDPQDLGQIILYAPISVDCYELQDLGALLKSEATLSAVFNEILTVGAQNDSNSFEVKKKGHDYLTVHPINLEQDLILEHLVSGGMLLKFSAKFCAKLSDPGEHYFRLRFRMKNGGEKVFSKDTTGEDGFLLSSVAISEITELRFNEARSLPNILLERVERESWLQPRISTLHYFLVRDTGFDLVAAHSTFRKMRRLEPLIWEWYLSGSMPQRAAEKMIIYHWRSGSGADSNVSDVVTLARFRRSRPNFVAYILAVIMLGALGSATHALIMSGTNDWLGRESALTAFIICAVAALALVAWAIRLPLKVAAQAVDLSKKARDQIVQVIRLR